LLQNKLTVRALDGARFPAQPFSGKKPGKKLMGKRRTAEGVLAV
jgi:hypothetical protein